MRATGPQRGKRARPSRGSVRLGALALASLACAARVETQAAAPGAPRALGSPFEPGACPVAPSPSGPARVIAPEQRVPDFVLTTPACRVFDSRELVGRVPFVVAFFASWCSVCEEKMPALQAALERRAGQVVPIWVTLDGPSEGTAPTEAFLARHALEPASAVVGQEFLAFSLGYNPFRSVPVIVVVGRSGRVAAVQIGVREGDEAALERALERAIAEPPERPLVTSSPRL